MRKMIFALILVLLTFSTTAMAGSTPSGVVNINPRIAAKVAQRIVEYRSEHPLLTPYIALEGQTTLTKKVAAPPRPRASKPATTASN